jgi:glycosyltransferase involved in cell wall biosynthesis
MNKLNVIYKYSLRNPLVKILYMKLLFTLQNFPPSKFGGISTSMFTIIKALNNAGYDIKVLTTNFKLPNQKGIKTNQWTSFDGIAVNYIETKSPAFSFRLFFEGFKQIIKTDQIHVSSIFYFPSLLFVLFSNIMGKTIILTPHGELQKPALQYKSWKKIPYLFLMQIIFKKSIFRVTSEDEAVRTRLYFPKSKIVIIPNLFNLGLPLYRSKLKQFVFLGRICKIKRIENLILACSISKHFISSNYSLLIAGPSDSEFNQYETMIRKLITDNNLEHNIELIGEIHSPQKEVLLSQSKALFLVSSSENFGNVVLESLAQGTPVVASTGTPWQSLTVKNCGYWIENTPESIAKKIDEFIVIDNESYDKMSFNAISHSKEFSFENLLPRWVEVIEKTHMTKLKFE